MENILFSNVVGNEHRALCYQQRLCDVVYRPSAGGRWGTSHYAALLVTSMPRDVVLPAALVV